VRLSTAVTTDWMNLTNSETDIKFYLIVYGSLVGANSALAFIRAFLFAYGGLVAASVIHTKLLDSIMKVGVVQLINYVKFKSDVCQC